MGNKDIYSALFDFPSINSKPEMIQVIDAVVVERHVQIDSPILPNRIPVHPAPQPRRVEPIPPIPKPGCAIELLGGIGKPAGEGAGLGVWPTEGGVAVGR